MESSDRDSNLGHASTVLFVPDSEPQFDVFFVHGLSGHPIRSWTKNNCCWPRDILQTADGFERSRIISLGYNLKFIGAEATSQSIHDHARGMLADIRRFRSGVTGRPILFFAHNIGGNILKEVLIASFHEDVPEGENIARSTMAILFFATPQRGTEALNVLYRTMQIARLLGIRTATRLVKQLRPGTDYLYETSIRFNEVLRAVQMQIFSFYATRPLASGLFPELDSPSREDVLIGNPNEQCLSLEGAPGDIHRMSGQRDPNYERVLSLIRPLMQTMLLPRAPKIPPGSMESLPDETPSYAESETIRTLEQGMLRVVVTKWSCNSERGDIDAPVAAIIDKRTDANVISRAFVAENLPHSRKNAGLITLTFRPANGGGAQSRHFEADDIPHPMILGAGGMYSRLGSAEAMINTNSGISSRLSTIGEQHLSTVIQNTHAQQIGPRVVPATSNKQAKTSFPGETMVALPAAAFPQGNPISSIHTMPKTTSSGILSSSGNLARSMTEVAGSSSALTPATGISLGALAVSTASGATAMYGARVARGAKAQATRSADIAESNLQLGRDVFQYQKAKDVEAKKEKAAAAAAAVRNSAAVVRSSQSDSDSDDTDSGVGRSSSKSTFNRVGRTKHLSSTIPNRLDFFPAVPTHSFDTRPPSPTQPLQPVDGLNIEMDELLSPNDAKSVTSMARPQPEHPVYSDGSRTAQAPSLPSAEDVEARKDESNRMTTTLSDPLEAETLPFDQDHGIHTELETREGPVGAVDNIHGSDAHSSLQQDSTRGIDEEFKKQETEPDLVPQHEPVYQQSENNPSRISSPDIVKELVEDSESNPHIATQAKSEEQDDTGTGAHQDTPSKMFGETPSSTEPEPVESCEEELPISISAKDASDGIAKNEHDRGAKDILVSEGRNRETVSQEGDCRETKAGNEELEDVGTEADPTKEGEQKIKGESEACAPGSHEAIGRARTW